MKVSMKTEDRRHGGLTYLSQRIPFDTRAVKRPILQQRASQYPEAKVSL